MASSRPFTHAYCSFSWQRTPRWAVFCLFGALYLLPGALCFAPGATAAPWAPQSPSTFKSRTGLRVVVIHAPSSPWSVVQLHITTAHRGLSAKDAMSLHAYADALASAPNTRGLRADTLVKNAGGETHLARSLDAVVISDGLPSTNLDIALQALEQRLRARNRLLPALVPIPSVAGPKRPPLFVRQMLAPGHPYALMDDGRADPTSFLHLSDRLLRKENITVVILAPQRPAAVLSRLNRWVRTPLKRGTSTTEPPAAFKGTRAVSPPPADGAPADRAQQTIDPEPTRLWFPIGLLARAPDAAEDSLTRGQKRAALLVIAHLLDGEAGDSDALGWLVLQVDRAATRSSSSSSSSSSSTRGGRQGDGRRGDGRLGEKRRLAELAVLTRPLHPSVLDDARAYVRAENARPLADPERLALALGTEVHRGRHAHERDQGLQSLTPAHVAALAQTLLDGGRVVVRAESAP